ncbi:MAG: ATP synthase F0 subunit C [Deltaproteobacteria bacterium]|nr:ATP synthase F0 subunit C [Deltaproteobacteria bacterium]MBW2149290.1 ATP synthase F0 subunit C [Deltaproteobacteria bacterium]MBW2307408.1 ATP synthase F0 subunit C [Deltaproteobacteria bacterium]
MTRKIVLSLLLSVIVCLGIAAVAMAEETAAAGGGGEWKDWGLAIGSGIGLALAALGGALGQGRVASAALEGIARNPGAADRMFVPMIIGLALIESLVLYTFIIAIFLQGKI